MTERCHPVKVNREALETLKLCSSSLWAIRTPTTAASHN